MRAIGLSVLFAVAAIGQPSGGVLEFFRTAAEGLSTKDAASFLDKFDRGMPGYSTLRDEVETLVGSADVGSAIEVVSDEGDDQMRSVELDWLLEVADRPARRVIVKCRIQRQGKKWKITGLEPVEFFKY